MSTLTQQHNLTLDEHAVIPGYTTTLPATESLPDFPEGSASASNSSTTASSTDSPTTSSSSSSAASCAVAAAAANLATASPQRVTAETQLNQPINQSINQSFNGSLTSLNQSLNSSFRLNGDSLNNSINNSINNHNNNNNTTSGYNNHLFLNHSFGSNLRQNVFSSPLTSSASQIGFGSHGSTNNPTMVQLVQPGFQPFATTVPGIQLNHAAYGNSSQVSPLAQLGGAGLQLQFQPQATPHVQPQMTLQGLQAFAAAMAAMNPHGGAAAVTPTTPITPLTPLSPLSLSHSLNLQSLSGSHPQTLASISPSSSSNSTSLHAAAQNALQTQISTTSAPSTASDPESPTSVTGASTSIQVAPTTSMELVWHGEYERLFAQYYPHRWHLMPTLKAPENLTQWRTFKDSAKVRFQCSSCGHGWTSMKGRVTFWYCLDLTTMEGFCQFKLYGQQCKRCANGTFEPAMWYPEEVVKVVGNVYNRIGQVYYGFWQPPMRIDRRQGKPGTQHNKDLCQACKDGECTEFQL